MIKRKRLLLVAVLAFVLAVTGPLSAVYATFSTYLLLPYYYPTWRSFTRNDIEQGGADVESYKSLSLRQINKVCTVEQPISDPLERDRVMKFFNYFRIKLAPEDTNECYSSSEIYLGQSHYFDQQGLLDADARGDLRVFKPGKEMNFRLRFSDAYASGEGKGNVGMVGQGWEFTTYPMPDGTELTVPNYVIIGVSYVYEMEAGGFTLPSGVYTVVGDFSTGFFDIYPINQQIGDITAWHNYTTKWHEGNVIEFFVDGTLVRTVDASSPALMRTGGAPLHVGAWLDNNDFSAGFSIQGTGYPLTEEQYMDIQFVKVSEL